MYLSSCVAYCVAMSHMFVRSGQVVVHDAEF